jgi:hypothetical protein
LSGTSVDSTSCSRSARPHATGADSLEAIQERIDRFVAYYTNHVRPHRALARRPPAETFSRCGSRPSPSTAAAPLPRLPGAARSSGGVARRRRPLSSSGGGRPRWQSGSRSHRAR